MRASALLLTVAIFACKAPTEGTGTTLAEESDTSTDSASTATQGESATETDPTTDGGTDPTTDGETETATESTDGETESATDSDTETTGGGPFADAVQYYCFGVCRVSSPPVGMDNCDQADADLFCQLVLNDPEATATEWESTTIFHGPGFCCGGEGLGTTVDFFDFQICWEPEDLLPDHGVDGVVIPRESLVCAGGSG